MDWQQVMSRPDFTEAEKAQNWAENCARRGMKPCPEAYKVKGQHRG